MRRLPASGSKIPTSHRGSTQRDALGDRRAVERVRSGAGGLHRGRVGLGALGAGGDEALVSEQAQPELALPAPPAALGVERERAQPRIAVGDAEDARQPRRLPGADALGLEHEHALVAPRQLVGGGEAADPGADDDRVPAAHRPEPTHGPCWALLRVVDPERARRARAPARGRRARGARSRCARRGRAAARTRRRPPGGRGRPTSRGAAARARRRRLGSAATCRRDRAARRRGSCRRRAARRLPPGGREVRVGDEAERRALGREAGGGVGLPDVLVHGVARAAVPALHAAAAGRGLARCASTRRRRSAAARGPARSTAPPASRARRTGPGSAEPVAP